MSSTTPPPTDRHGLPILTAPANTGVVGTTTIYDWLIPSELDPNKKTIWYDIQKEAPQVVDLPKYVTTGSNPRGIELPGGGYGIIVQGPSPDGSPLVEMPDGSVQSLDSLHKHSAPNMVSPSELMRSIATMSVSDPKAFLAIQTYLSSGAWGTVHVNGVFDKETESALGQAMLDWTKLTRAGDQNPNDIGIAESFKKYLQTAGTTALNLGNGSGSSQAPFQPSLTDPTQIKADAQNAAQAALGRGLSPAELNAFVDHFHQEQIQSQRAAYNGVGNVTAPDLSSDAMQFVQQNNPKEYKQNQRSNFLDMLANMMAGSSVRPETSPVPSVGS